MITKHMKMIIVATISTFTILCIFVGGLGYLQNKRYEKHLKVNEQTLKELQNYRESLILTAQAFKIRNQELKDQLKECKGVER